MKKVFRNPVQKLKSQSNVNYPSQCMLRSTITASKDGQEIPKSHSRCFLFFITTYHALRIERQVPNPNSSAETLSLSSTYPVEVPANCLCKAQLWLLRSREEIHVACWLQYIPNYTFWSISWVPYRNLLKLKVKRHQPNIFSLQILMN